MKIMEAVNLDQRLSFQSFGVQTVLAWINRMGHQANQAVRRNNQIEPLR